MVERALQLATESPILALEGKTVEKTNIKVNPSACTLCSSCQLRCSLAYTGVFNPLKARIIVEPGYISFTNDCIANCHLCADYCVYGALVRL